MDEKRKFFRVKNSGQIQATYNSHAVEIMEVSNSGAVIKKNDYLPNQGTIKITIHNFSTDIEYHILRVDEEKEILNFKNDDEVDGLFTALKHLRDERNHF